MSTYWRTLGRNLGIAALMVGTITALAGAIVGLCFLLAQWVHTLVAMGVAAVMVMVAWVAFATWAGMGK
jgi:di/tricarboxylate transporter